MRNNDLSRYEAPGVRDAMRPGDVIAYSGTKPISKFIGLFSGRSWNPKVPALSHISLINVAMEVTTMRVRITQSTIADGKSGAQGAYLSDDLSVYPGQAWWCPLSDEIRALANWPKFQRFVAASEGHVTYPIPALFGFLLRGIPIVGPRIFQDEDPSGMVCSSYGTASFEEDGAGFLRGINYAQVSPQQLLEMKIYAPAAPVQLIGKPAMFAGYNSI